MTVASTDLPAATQTIALRREGAVLYVLLDRPAVRNAMSPEMVAELLAVAHHLLAASGRERSEPPGIGHPLRVVVIRGAGGNFSAGGDLKGMLERPAGGDLAPTRESNRAFGTLLERLARIPQILVVGVEGAAMGGGLGLVCVSDIALASEDATFGTPEVTLGLVPAQIAPFLVRRVGRAQAQRLALLGARLGARQALALGLVHEVLADGSALERSLADVVDQARRCGPRAVARTKWLLSRVGEMTMGRVLDDAADVFAESIADEAPEGIAAFLKRSVPRWAE